MDRQENECEAARERAREWMQQRRERVREWMQQRWEQGEVFYANLCAERKVSSPLSSNQAEIRVFADTLDELEDARTRKVDDSWVSSDISVASTEKVIAKPQEAQESTETKALRANEEEDQEGAYSGKLSASPSVLAEWKEFERELKSLRDTIRNTEDWELDLFARFDNYQCRTGWETLPSAVFWAARIHDRREEQASIRGIRRARVVRRRDEERTAREEEELLEKLRRERKILEEEVQREERAAADRTKRARERLGRAKMEEALAQSAAERRAAARHRRQEEVPRCYVCGLSGVRRSQHCPERATHAKILKETGHDVGKK